MKSYIKIYGPPTKATIRALEGVAVDMPEICIMDRIILKELLPTISRELGEQHRHKSSLDRLGLSPGIMVRRYFEESENPITLERCDTIISKSGEDLGEYDFFFEWFKDPDLSQVEALITRIDEALASLGCYYTITTKR